MGSSRPASEVIRKLTRGRSSRISPESLVKYFKPLELWLRVQNRDEPIIGWNTNYEDMSLFSPYNSGIRSINPISISTNILVAVVLIMKTFVS